MKKCRVFRILPVLALLTSVPAVGLSPDRNLSLEEVRKVASKLVQSVGPANDCDIFNLSVRNVSSSDAEPSIYFVSYDAIGLRCESVNQALKERGKSQGLWFMRRPKHERIDKIPEEPNIDPIHEADPPDVVG